VSQLKSGPTEVWRAALAQRRELQSQLGALQNTRGGLSRQLQQPRLPAVDRRGLEQQLAETDAQIGAVEKQLAAANADVAKAAAVPGAVQEEPRPVRDGPPQEVYVLGGMFIVFVLLPLSIAAARRIWRRGTAALASLPRELMDRLDQLDQSVNRLDQSVDSIAVEVERIGEGQRFVTRLMSERSAAPALPLERER
jgi:septation ring formation regulator EzrA